MVRVADFIFDFLHRAGVNHVFQVTGRGSLFLGDALAKNKGIQSVSLHHEQSCAFAAVAYAEATGHVGAALVSTGCASTNALTGVLSAWQDGIPCIFISGQNVLSETTRYTGIPLRTYGQQEADIVRLVSPITKFAHMISEADQVFEVLERALELARSGRPGPVWIDVPLDLQSAMVDPEARRYIEIRPKKPTSDLTEADVAEVVDLIGAAKRPVLLIGRGVRAAGAESKLKAFVESWRLPLTFSASAPDTYGGHNEYSIGSVGAMGCSRAGNFAVANCDLLIVLGSRINSLTTGIDFCKFARAARVVVVDIDPVEHRKKSINIDKFVECDLNVFFSSIVKYPPIETSRAWVDRCLHWKKLFSPIEDSFVSKHEVDLYQLARSLSSLLPSPSTLVTDSGLIEVILPSNILFKDGVRCIHPVSQGAMGFAVPAAIGAQFASNDPVICVVGDGSIMMNLQELESIRYLQLPIKIFVVNNNVYSIIRRRQRDLFRTRTIGTDPSNGVSCPKFSEVAKCFGLSFFKIDDPANLDFGIQRALNHNGPVLCEIKGREDQDYIEVALTKSNETKKLVRRPLEDQRPFLERKLFISEMIVEPIDQ